MRPILVPHDFTEVGAYALEHAFMIGKTHNNPINVIHIVSKSDEIEPAKAKLQGIIDEFKKDKPNLDVTVEVRKGDVDKEIYKYGTEIDALLAVMGTHGVKNLKKAMKMFRIRQSMVNTTVSSFQSMLTSLRESESTG